MTVYVAVQQAVYRHALVGVYTTEEAAIEAGLKAIRAESDRHHGVDIVAMELDRPVPDIPWNDERPLDLGKRTEKPVKGLFPSQEKNHKVIEVIDYGWRECPNCTEVFPQERAKFGDRCPTCNLGAPWRVIGKEPC